MIIWKPSDRSLRNHKLKLLDSCSYGELWLCELIAQFKTEISHVYGGLITWFFQHSTVRKLNRKQWSFYTDKIGVNRVKAARRIVSLKEHG